MELPKVSIVIANLNGRHHLGECFGSIQKLDYPKEKIEVIVVDNGSTDGSVELMQQKYSWVKLLRNAKNEGFAKPSNDGARAATGDYVAFINNDMRVQREWLIELVKSLENNNAKCAGSVILNWDGKLLDFGGGGVNFCGLGYQDDFQRPMKEMEPLLTQDKDILFACGGAMLVERELFLYSGGFDEDYFAYYEDVDLGWRLRVMGCRIVLSVKSRVYHKHNSTSKTIAKERIQYLFERNKLYTCFKNYGDELLHKVFLPSILLQVRDTYMSSGIDGFNYNIKNPGAFDSDPVNINQRTAMKLSALNEFTENISEMSKKRQFIQQNRKAQDNDISKLVGKPFIVFEGDSGEFLNAEYDIVKAFGIDELLLKRLKTGVLFVSGVGNDSEKRRTVLKNALDPHKNDIAISVACFNDGGAEENAVIYKNGDFTALMEAVRKSTAVVLMDSLPLENPEFERAVAKKYVISDIESLLKSSDTESDDRKKTALFKKIIGITDYFICGDEKQSDYLKGMTAATAGEAMLNKNVITVIGGSDSEEALTAFAGYCLAPRRNPARRDIGIFEFTSDVPATPVTAAGNIVYTDSDSQTDGSTGISPVSEQLARIERQQEQLAQLIMSDKRLLKEAHTGVKELKDWSLLMESRFFKLKRKLMRFKFLRRFVG